MVSFILPAPVCLALPSDSLGVVLPGWVACGNLLRCKGQNPVSVKILLFPRIGWKLTTLF